MATAQGLVFVSASFHFCCAEEGRQEIETRSFVVGLDVETGEMVWRTEAGGSVPVTGGGLVLSQAPNGEIHALHAVDGTPAWVHDIGPDEDVSPQQQIIGDMTTLDMPDLYATDDAVYAVGTAQRSGPTLFAIDLATGTHRWTFTPTITPLRIPSRHPILTPYIMNVPAPGTNGVRDGELYVTTGSRIHAVDVGTGEERWNLDITTISETRSSDGRLGFDVVTTPPVVAEAVVYFGGGRLGAEPHGVVYAIDPVRREVTGRYRVEAGGPSPLSIDANTVYFAIDPPFDPRATEAAPARVVAIAADRAFTPLEPPPAPATLSGRVTETRTGAPIEGATVALAGVIPRSTTTDETGHYELSDIPPHTDHTFTVSRPDHFYTVRRGVALAAGERRDDVDFAMEKGATIRGRLTDPGGTGAGGSRVHLLRVTEHGDQMVARQSGRTETDATGQFRFGPLAPGAYYLLARPPEADVFLNGSEAGAVLVRTFYPGTTASADAALVEVTTAQDVTRDFALRQVETAPLAGTVTWSDSTPAEAANIYFKPIDDLVALASAGTYQASVDREGRFHLAGVLPGEYAAWATPFSNDNRPREGAHQIVALPDEGMRDLRLVTRKGLGFRGRVILEGPGAAQVDLTRLQVMLDSSGIEPDWAQPMGQTARAPVTDDGTFEVEEGWGPLFGRRRLYTRGLPQGEWLLESVVVDGREVVDAPVDLLNYAGEDIELTLTSRVGTVSGRVVDWDPATSENERVVVFADHPSPADASYTTRQRVGLLRPDADGRFGPSHPLVPGDYFAAVVQRLPPNWQVPDFFESLRERAISLVVEEDTNTVVDIRSSR